MALKLFNTLSGAKEEFVPLVPGKVGMYVCGVTVYDHCHIGHARANVVFDVIYRYLLFSGYDVTYVRNYTDIDDKIINRANERGISWKSLAEEFIGEFDRDMAALGIRIPTHQPRATDHIDDIISIVSRLIEKGYAYATPDGDVYFRVDRFPGYLRLSKRNMEEMQAGARVEVDGRKENPMDFALWKGSKPGEPAWDSPWGPGRPGWHIECSAMSMRYLGETFDIHGGGKDLVFPHHENEIAQSEAANGRPFVRYWIHNGFVNVDSEKMSKSLGNFFTIKEVLARYDAEVLRFFLISSHYRSPIDFCDQNLSDAEAGLSRIYEALAQLEDALTAPEVTVKGESAADLDGKAGELRERFREAMDDDFNTARALALLFDLVRSLNRYLSENGGRGDHALLRRVREGVAAIAGVLGVPVSSPRAFIERMKARRTAALSLSPEEIEELIQRRADARRRKDFAESDRIRDQLLSHGIILLDSPQGTTWRVKQ